MKKKEPPPPSPFFPKSPDFERALAQRYARVRVSPPPLTKTRGALALPRIEGKRGEIVVASSSFSNALFRGERLFATDTSARPGHGTVIEDVLVGSKPQPQLRGVPTWIFSEHVPEEDLEVARAAALLVGTRLETEEIRKLAARLRFSKMIDLAMDGFRLDTCLPGLSIHFSIRFLEDCAWEGVLWGAMCA